MIKEDYVSFETAKLLKDKGFYIEDCFAFYKKNGEMGFLQTFGDIADYDSETCVIAPTLQMAMKWLREVHHLVIQIEFIDFLEHGEVWLYSIIERKTIKILTDRDENFTEHSYEEACEAAIMYCLENLI
jgi:hypothetical protein